MVAFNKHGQVSKSHYSVSNVMRLSMFSAYLDTPAKTLPVLMLSLAMMAGCQSTVTEPTSMMKTAQGAPNPEVAARARTAMAAEYIRGGDLDAAQRSLAIALKTEPRLPEANNMMGVLLQREGSEPNQIKAEEYFKKAISLKDDFAQARNNYGVFLSSRKRYAEAYTQFEIAGSQLGYTERYAALENLGITAKVLGKQAEAQQAFTQALQVNRNSLVARFELAQIFLTQNRIQAARTLYDEYLQLLGSQQQSASSLWLGMRIARQTQDTGRLQSLAERLQLSYPNSAEYQHYNELLKTGAAWD